MPNLRDLRRAILNGAGIVLSILLAFGIDAWWDARAERREEVALLEDLKEEFTANLRELDQMIGEFHRQDSLLARAFSLSTPETEEEADTEVGRFVYALLWSDLFDPNMASLEMLLNARFDLISSGDLRALLWTWKMQFEDTEDDTDNLRYFLQDGRHILGRLGARGYNHDLRPPRKQQFERMRSSQDVSALAQTVLTDRDAYRRELETLRATTALVLDSLP